MSFRWKVKEFWFLIHIIIKIKRKKNEMIDKQLEANLDKQLSAY